MTAWNVEFLRGVYAHWERGEFGSVDWADPDIEFAIADGPSPVRVTGIPAMARAWGETISSYEGLTVAAEEYREVDSERVLVLTRNQGRARGSGFDIGRILTPGANLFHIRDGRIVKMVLYFNRENVPADLSPSDPGGQSP